MEKQCQGKCQESKSLSAFYKHPKGKYGRASWCKQCQKDHMKDKRLEEQTPEQKERQERLDKERALEYGISVEKIYDRRAKLKKKYNITLLEYHELMDAQEGRCAICGKSANEERYRRLHIDHCHKENVVRGLLCISCNNGIGRFKDSPELLLAAADYLQTKGVINGRRSVDSCQPA